MRIKQLKYVKWGLLVLLGGFSLSAYAHNMTITLDNQSNCIVRAYSFIGIYGDFWGSTYEDAPVTLKEKGQKVPIQLSHTGGIGQGLFEISVYNKSRDDKPFCSAIVSAEYGKRFKEVSPQISRYKKGCGNYLTGFGKHSAGDDDFTLVYHPNKACD